MKLITSETLHKWNACADGYKRFCELLPNGAILKDAIDALVADNHDEWGYWLFKNAQNDEEYKKQTIGGYLNSGDMNSGDRNSGNLNSGNRNSGNLNSGNRNSGYLNSGDRNSGDRNSGNRNSGNLNSGNRNSGNLNSGNLNSGDMNSGDRNSGDRNSGDRNSGDRNSGDLNSGDRNSGNRNSGNRNSGNLNSGYLNSGNRNSGDLNSGNYNTGFFNTITPEDILVFNKPCIRKKWNDAEKPGFIYFDHVLWICESEMTDQEKIDNPKFFTTGGYVKTIGFKEAFQASYAKASDKDKELLKALPNFDADVFFEISGIRV